MEQDLVLAQHAALAGARLALRYFANGADVHPERKADGSLVTEADRAVEATIRQILARERPADAILGEESGQVGSGRRRWIVDPIDGTALFAAGDDRWLILLALECDGQVAIAVVAAPAQGELWWARRGGGAMRADIIESGAVRGRAVACTRQPARPLPASRLGVIPSVESLSPRRRRLVEELSSVVAPRPWTTHPALLVAAGELDLACQAGGQVWDYAATSLIVEEAGGRFTGIGGRGHPHSGPALYSSGGASHDIALRYLESGYLRSGAGAGVAAEPERV